MHIVTFSILGTFENNFLGVLHCKQGSTIAHYASQPDPKVAYYTEIIFIRVHSETFSINRFFFYLLGTVSRLIIPRCRYSLLKRFT